ncbi:hypothetical protein [Lysobacter changpingensis]|uniref:hypothetical protein n=1 Tax=Lysobacter changpingensis TaxID=2792784 RepID=UPI001A8F290D|nr:hypothetical protein [Lysobacter changpingensis]
MNVLTYLLIAVSTLCTLSAQLMLKKVIVDPATREAMAAGPTSFILSAAMHPFTWLALCLQVGGYVVWFFVLSRERLAVSFALSGSLFYILTALAAWHFYSERLTPYQWSGIIFISIGVMLIARQG